MTDPTAWPNPDRPGVPLNPERDGWHWVSRPMHGVLPMQWLEIAGGGWAGDTICILASEAARMNWRYLGLCLTPAEVAAAVQAEREACEQAACDASDPPGVRTEFEAQIANDAREMVMDAIRARGPTDALATALAQARRDGMVEAAGIAIKHGQWASNDIDSDSPLDRFHAEPRMSMAQEIQTAILAATQEGGKS